MKADKVTTRLFGGCAFILGMFVAVFFATINVFQRGPKWDVINWIPALLGIVVTVAGYFAYKAADKM